MSWSQKLGGRGGNFSSSSSNNNNNKILQDDAPSLPTTTSTSSSSKASNNNINKNNNSNNNKPTLSKAWANNTLIPKPHSQQQEEQQQQQGQQQETLLTKLSNAKNQNNNKNDNDDDKANNKSNNNKQQQQAAANSTANNNTKTNQIDYYVVLDFEATCQEGPRIKPQEIIEFPSVVVDANRCVIVAEFQRYVRPVHHPKLSQFCTDLTGIPQKVVDEASTFAVVYQQYFKWLESIGLTQKEASSRVAWVTCGDWDLKTMLPTQLKNPRPSREEEPEDSKCSLPRTAPLNFQRWVNLKFAFQKFVGRRPGGMTEMLDALGLTMTGHHHSGIDDCRNIARCLMAMLKKGNRVELTFGEFSPEETSWQVQRPAYPVLDEKGGVSRDLAQLSKAAQEALQRTQAASKIQQQVNDVGNDSRNNKNNTNKNNAAASSSSSGSPPTGTNTESQAPSRRMRGMPAGNDDSSASSAANNNNNNNNRNAAPLSASGLLPIVEVDKSRNAIKEILTAANINMSQGPDAAQRAAFPQGPQQMTRVSKSLSSALRHNAIQWRIPMSLNGFVRVTDLTRNNHFHQTNPTQLAALCFTNDKQRFGLFFGATKETANTLYIRANQGHSIEELELDLERITDPRKAPIAVHGTYLAAWNAIRTQGLSRMNRQHIHLAKGLPGQNGVISGMRSSCQVLIYVNVPKMLKDGIPLYQSENGVLLTSGVDGILSPDYFEKVIDRRNNREIN